MRVSADPDDRLTEQAARWLGTLIDRSDVRSEFFAWLEQSPRHVEEFLSVLADAQDLAALSSVQRARIEELSLELGGVSGESNVIELPPSLPLSRPQLPAVDQTLETTARPRQARRSVLLGWAAGLAAVALVATTWWLMGPGAWKTYSTAVGEQRAVSLADGSVVHLNTESAISVRMTDSARDLRLVRGEALFSVKRDPGHPFLVRTRNAVIQALGTRFNVYSRDDRTQVAVIEGLVQVSRADEPSRIAAPNASGSRSEIVKFLSAGEATDVTPGGKVSDPHAVDPAKAIAWRQRRLVFEDASLAEIAAQFNRYNAVVKIRVSGATATERRFSGTFDADAPDAMMQALVGEPFLHVARVGNEILISATDRSGS